MLNFPKINTKIGFNFKNINNARHSAQTLNVATFNAANIAPLKQDTITFSARHPSVDKASRRAQGRSESVVSVQKRSSKTLERKSDMGSLKVANDILKEEDVEFAFERFKTDISSIFGMPVIDFTNKKLKEENKEEYVAMLAENINKNSPILAITARKKEAASIKEKMGSKHVTTKKKLKND